MDAETEGTPMQNKRLACYKSRSGFGDQEIRRWELLQKQKRKRESTLNEFRHVNELFTELDEEDEKIEEAPVVENDSFRLSNEKPKFSKLKDMFMLSEWMIKLPENFEDKWLFVLCPVGKRCLVRCTRGQTTVYGKRGHLLAKFQSSLPNGSQIDCKRLTYSSSEVTLLDCIWNPQVKSYFILDLLSWKGQFYMDTETSFRGFWIKSKLQEMPWLSERSQQNPFPFYALDYYPCNLDTLSTMLSRHSHFTCEAPKIDGILFYHSEAYYTPGSTPLVVWLKPFMIPELFRIDISEAYMATRPPFYVNMARYICDYENNEKRKKNKNRIKKQNFESADVVEVEMMEPIG